MPALVAALASRLVPGAVAADVPGVDSRLLAALAKDLADNRGRGLIVAGPAQPQAVHLAVLNLNAALGNVGATVVYQQPVDAALPSHPPCPHSCPRWMRAASRRS